MKVEKSSRYSPITLEIRDGRAADILTNPKSLRHLEPFLGCVNTVTEAARETGAKANTTLRRVRRFRDLGLLKVVGERRRPGRSIKLYRSTADVFFVPFDATLADSLEALMHARDAYWERLLRMNVVRSRQEAVGSWGTRIYRDARGRLQIQTAVTARQNTTTLEPADPAVLSSWRDNVYLDFQDAKALQREMFALLQRYQQKQGAQRYIIRLGMAPLVTN